MPCSDRVGPPVPAWINAHFSFIIKAVNVLDEGGVCGSGDVGSGEGGVGSVGVFHESSVAEVAGDVAEFTAFIDERGDFVAGLAVVAGSFFRRIGRSTSWKSNWRRRTPQ